jgi:F-type H+-transporting ATPase subunit a
MIFSKVTEQEAEKIAEHSADSTLAAESAHTAEAASASDAAHAASHGEGGGITEMLEHHIMNSNTVEIPFIGEVPLPQIHVFGLDLSITKHVVMMWIASLLLLLIFGLAFRKRKMVPSGLALALETIVQYVRDEIAIKIIGEDGKKYTSYLLTTFFFILTCNLLGLVPYGATATGNIGVTAALAGIAFIIIQSSGIIKLGPIGYVKSLAPHGVSVFLLPIIIVIEIIGMFVKPFALCIRLFANMIAGHISILILLSFIFIFKTIFIAPASVLSAVFMYFLELLIAFIQAYIFTILTSLFIGLTVQPQH